MCDRPLGYFPQRQLTVEYKLKTVCSMSGIRRAAAAASSLRSTGGRPLLLIAGKQAADRDASRSPDSIWTFTRGLELPPVGGDRQVEHGGDLLSRGARCRRFGDTVAARFGRAGAAGRRPILLAQAVPNFPLILCSA
jgi:hypothetical protein